MYLEVYPDIIFILNLFIDFVLLFLLKKVNRRNGKVIRLVGASAVGSVFAVMVSLYPQMNIFLRFIIMNIVAAVIMIRIAFGRMHMAEMLKQVIVLYLITFFTGGMLNSIYYYTNLREKLIKVGNALVFSDLSMKYILIMMLCLIPITCVSLWFLRWYQSDKRETYDVELYFQDCNIHTKGLMDSGNCLYDPVFRKPVMVIEDSIIKELLPTQASKEVESAKHYLEGNDVDKAFTVSNENTLRLRFIPYQSIGKSKGMMLGLVLDKVLIHTGKETICNEKVTAAICDNHLSVKDEYHVILHKGLL